MATKQIRFKKRHKGTKKHPQKRHNSGLFCIVKQTPQNPLTDSHGVCLYFEAT
ncbi:MAG: hypothetical protein JFT11_06035 [Muribaculaceae bacterium]|nr:hypothetical protein [Muribaculaceae bacterium]